jgi:hypothetical protein
VGEKPYACVIFNVHVEHRCSSIRAGDAFRRLINIALKHGGSTTHLPPSRAAPADGYADTQLPRVQEAKRKYDKDEVFQSDWYRHYRRMYFGS